MIQVPSDIILERQTSIVDVNAFDSSYTNKQEKYPSDNSHNINSNKNKISFNNEIKLKIYSYNNNKK